MQDLQVRPSLPLQTLRLLMRRLVALGTTDFTLAECHVLRVLNLQLTLHGMLVGTDPNLPWLCTIFSQITSPYLREITLCIQADPMSDLSGLDSECAVRPLFPASFADLVELDWVSFYRTVVTEAMYSLHAFKMEGRGPTLPLKMHLDSVIPTWNTLEFVSLK